VGVFNGAGDGAVGEILAAVGVVCVHGHIA
jgi:hypothetical protein